MKILIFSRNMAENKSIVDTNCTVPHIWISFRDPDLQPAKLPDNPFRKDALFLAADDCNGDENGNYIGDVEYSRKWQAFQPEQAKQIVDFVRQWKDKVEMICVNCEAGRSRSAGCASAISLWLNDHDSGIGGSDRYDPNAHIKSLILRQIWSPE
jgi:predicted protein tyrosine phosphatase